MNAGLPGTGLGGLFYLLLALLMPFYELVQTVRGRSSRERWRLVLTQLGVALGIIAVMVGVLSAARRLVPGEHGLGTNALLAPAVGLGVLAVLTTVVTVWGATSGRAAANPAHHVPEGPAQPATLGRTG